MGNLLLAVKLKILYEMALYNSFSLMSDRMMSAESFVVRGMERELQTPANGKLFRRSINPGAVGLSSGRQRRIPRETQQQQQEQFGECRRPVGEDGDVAGKMCGRSTHSGER